MCVSVKHYSSPITNKGGHWGWIFSVQVHLRDKTFTPNELNTRLPFNMQASRLMSVWKLFWFGSSFGQSKFIPNAGACFQRIKWQLPIYMQSSVYCHSWRLMNQQRGSVPLPASSVGQKHYFGSSRQLWKHDLKILAMVRDSEYTVWKGRATKQARVNTTTTIHIIDISLSGQQMAQLILCICDILIFIALSTFMRAKTTLESSSLLMLGTAWGTEKNLSEAWVHSFCNSSRVSNWKSSRLSMAFLWCPGFYMALHSLLFLAAANEGDRWQ